MAVVLGTNAGFVTVAPTADPGGLSQGQDTASRATKDTAPAGVSKITEIGWWCDTATPDANFEVGLYSHDASGNVPLNRLFVSATNAKGTTAGWKTVAVDWTITPGTIYWIALQLDNTTPNTSVDFALTGGRTSIMTGQGSLANPWVSAGAEDYIHAFYALVGSPITIDSVDLYLGLGSARSGWNINVSITDFGSFSAAPDATAVLGTKSRDVSVVPVGSADWISFVFDTPITIGESGFIGLNVTTDAPSAYQAIALRWYHASSYKYFTGSLPDSERCYRYDNTQAEWESFGPSICLAYRINCTGSTDNVADTPLSTYAAFSTTSWKLGHRSYMDAAGASSTVLINSTRLGAGGLFILCTTDDGVYISTDFGGTWAQKLPDGAASIVWDLGVCSGDGAYMIVERSSDNALYKSSDTGTTWGLITPAGADSFSVSDMAMSQDGQFVVVVGTNATDSSKSCYKSIDYGVTWTSINPIVTTEAWTRCDISDDGNLITVSKTDRFYASFNGGTTWKEQFPPASHQIWDDLSVSGDGKVGIITNLGDTNEFFKTQSWESVPTVSTTTLTAFIRTLLDDATAAAAATTLGLGTGDSPIFAGLTLTSPLVVGSGGTGVATLTDHGLLLGSGTGAITPLAAATNGQIPIGSTGADPVLATITGTANQVTVTNGAGAITLALPQDYAITSDPTLAGLNITSAADFAANAITFQPAADSTTFFQILDQDGGTPIFNVDSVNERVGIGTAAPKAKLHIVSYTTGATAAAGYDDMVFEALNGCGSTYLSGDAEPGGIGFGYESDSLLHAIIAYGPSHGTYPSGMNIYVNNGYRIIILSSGNIGINETAPETLTEWTHATPYLTIHNNTHEDTAGGRESRIIAKGEQSGGEETTLGYMEFGHDGAADDEKGYWKLYTNDGNDAAAPTLRLTVDSAGDFTFFDGSDFILGSATGTKIGTATTQLLGFYGVTPVDQPATVADAAVQDLTGTDTVDKAKVTADILSCKNTINAIIDRLQELGLVA